MKKDFNRHERFDGLSNKAIQWMTGGVNAINEWMDKPFNCAIAIGVAYFYQNIASNFKTLEAKYKYFALWKCHLKALVKAFARVTFIVG